MSRQFFAQSIQTRIFKAGEPIIPFVCEALRSTTKDTSSLEGSILAITSKIVSLSEGCLIEKDKISKVELIKKESDIFLGEMMHGSFLTIKHGLFIASAGIDESNSENGHYILYPTNPVESAWNLREGIAKEFNLKNFAVILTDSRTTPLRAGVTGLTLAHAGFRGVEDLIGKNDLFGRPLQMTRINVADALSSAAVFCMGEAAEATPLAILRAAVTFNNEKENSCAIAPEDDLYAPLYNFIDKNKS